MKTTMLELEWQERTMLLAMLQVRKEELETLIKESKMKEVVEMWKEDFAVVNSMIIKLHII